MSITAAIAREPEQPGTWWSLLGGAGLVAFGMASRGPARVLAPLAGAYLLYRGVTRDAPLYRLMDLGALFSSGGRDGHAAAGPVRLEAAVQVNRPAVELYRFWRNLTNLPRFMRSVEAVTVEGPKSHWVVRGPMGARFEWDAQVLIDRADEMIAWKSLPGGDVDSVGAVEFRELPAGRGTEVRVALKYTPPAGPAGATLAALLGQSPHCQLREDLRVFKQLVETGERATNAGQPVGTRY
jgi:uncharacterized membrane protein